MDLKQLKYLVLVARHASIGAAAAQLNLTQPALSKSIRALEESTGVRLLERGPWGVKPTAYGEKLIEYADLLLSLTEEARSEIDAMRGAKRGRLRIGAITTAIRELAPTAIKAFMASHPDVEVSFTEDMSPGLHAAVLSGAIDVAVVVRPRDVSDDVEFVELLDLPVDIVADRAHPLVGDRVVALEELTGYRWLIPSRPEPDRMALDAMFTAARLPRPVAVCETTSANFQVAMIAGSQWLSYLTRTSAYRLGPGAQFVALTLDRPTWSRDIGLIYRRRSMVRPVINSFVRELKLAFADFRRRNDL
ncbi:LysR family transcriptional regulator [uncultured Alsobacter sp.]|uniref:LysR family transcriptional regulator n=1 Tax=uncultured Alsobacter sp. TaxID=1748258 RepID=UPI0025FABE94|nr:LysR family transcriptional regulator [uncultured Alsobacter sp.]